LAEALTVKCGRHGPGTAASICGHVAVMKSLPLGFVENSDDPNDLQGWCFACEHLFLKEGEMNQRFKAFCHTPSYAPLAMGRSRRFTSSWKLMVAPNPSIERTSYSRLRRLQAAAHVER
jgi:hypothetical protein